MDNISWKDFEKIDIRTGTIVDIKEFTKARKPAYQLWIDFGPGIGIKRSSAQITALYPPESLKGQQVIAVINFPPKQIADFISECLVLGIYNENNEVILLKPQQKVSNGLKIG
ncbi:MAG TPA: tRNA-binding protein [Flavisolibacter sp.]|jgi:tRNA-binding protein|nr:tRNA-binding protein [Flavisolibacter sp.]